MKVRLSFLVCLIFCCQLPLAVWVSAANDDSAQKAEELFNFGKEQLRSGDAKSATEPLQRALVQFQSLSNKPRQAATHLALGDSYLALHMLDAARQHFELAFQLYEQIRDSRNQADALRGLGYVEAVDGAAIKATSYFTQAQNLSVEKDFALRGKVAAGMAYLFDELGLYDDGLAQHRRAKEYYRLATEVDDAEGRPAEDNLRYYKRQILLVGYSYYLLQNYVAAIEHLEQALDLFVNSTDPSRDLDIAQCQEYLGRVFFEKGEYSLALQYLEQVVPIYDKPGDDRDAAQVRALIGETYEQMRDVERARATYLEALTVLNKKEDRVKVAAVSFALGQLELGQNNYEAAEQYLKVSIKNTEDIRHGLDSRVFATAFSASVHKRYEAYIECLMRMHSQNPTQNYAIRAFEASELSRARSLAELLRDTQTKVLSGADPQLIAEERTLRQAIREKKEQSIKLLSGPWDKALSAKLASSLTELREQYNGVVQQLQKQNAHFDEIKVSASYSLPQIQEQIVDDDQTTLLEYFLGKKASYVWAITPREIKVFKLPAADEITSAARNVYELLETAPKGDSEQRLNQATAKLAEKILGPVANELKGRRVIVVADGALNYIPFQLLPGMANSQTPLVENYEIVNAPSASVVGQLRLEKQHRRSRTNVLAAFGDPVFPENYAQFKNVAGGNTVASASATKTEQRNSRGIEVQGDSLDSSTIQSLMYSKFELNDLSKIAGPSSLVRRGFDASRAVFETTDFSKFTILHVATHAVLHPESPENSGFYLSTIDTAGQPQPGLITMQDVYSLQVPVDLVVLSACRTALGEEVSGEGLIGLTRGFMHAGASSVVASLWKVDDEATAELMKIFYTNMLQKGMRPAEALRAAQNTLRQDARWRAPHFWAAFTLQGEFKEPLHLPQPTGASPAVQNAVGAALLLLLLSGVGWGFWRRRSNRGLNG